MTKNKQEKGITLIALVVTIVVLLILAGVSINAIFNDNGIIKRAQEAQNKMDEAQQKDLNSMNELNNWIDNNVNITTGNITTGETGNLITFTVGDIQFQAERDMSWMTLIVSSEYNKHKLIERRRVFF